jgi:hypothetical protein
VHAPLEHEEGAQLMAQSPQLAASDVTSMHAPLHSFSPAFGHVQAPLTHVWPPGHAAPHAPQLLTSVDVFTQAEPQYF